MSKKSDLIVNNINKLLKFTQTGKRSPDSYTDALAKIDDYVQVLLMDLHNASSERDAFMVPQGFESPFSMDDRVIMQTLWSQEIDGIIDSIKKIGVFDEQSDSKQGS